MNELEKSIDEYVAIIEDLSRPDSCPGCEHSLLEHEELAGCTHVLSDLILEDFCVCLLDQEDIRLIRERHREKAAISD